MNGRPPPPISSGWPSAQSPSALALSMRLRISWPRRGLTLSDSSSASTG
nr:hypothetical protein [uncultured bacterium]